MPYHYDVLDNDFVFWLNYLRSTLIRFWHQCFLLLLQSLLKSVYVMARYARCQALSYGRRGRCGCLFPFDHAGVGQGFLGLVKRLVDKCLQRKVFLEVWLGNADNMLEAAGLGDVHFIWLAFRPLWLLLWHIVQVVVCLCVGHCWPFEAGVCRVWGQSHKVIVKLLSRLFGVKGETQPHRVIWKKVWIGRDWVMLQLYNLK